MKLSEALARMREIDHARDDEGNQSQYDRPEQPGEYDRLVAGIEAELGSSAFLWEGVVWYLTERGLTCASLIDDIDL